MRPIQRPELSAGLNKRLQKKAGRCAGLDSKKMRGQWRGAKTLRRDLGVVLDGMALGVKRCMYCGDNLGTDIDHFKPIAIDSNLAFSWPNHLLSCSHCNSNLKRDQFPLDAAGNCLLIDPTKEDPKDHLSLILSTGDYIGITAKGIETIRVFGLSRPSLVQGRRNAFVRSQSMLRDWLALTRDGQEARAAEVLDSLYFHPFGDVLYAMVSLVDSPGAVHVFDDSTLSALRLLKQRDMG